MNARKWKRVLAIAATLYGTVWLATWLYGAEIVRERIEREARVDWEAYRPIKAPDPRLERWRERISYRQGPKVSHEAACPLPLIVRADVVVMLGSSNGRGFVGWYLVTPWHAFLLKQIPTGIS